MAAETPLTTDELRSVRPGADAGPAQYTRVADAADARAYGRTARLALFTLPWIAALVLVSVLYASTFRWWYYEWITPGTYYAHAIFVPFFVGVMVWRSRERLAAARWRPSWTGLLLVAIAAALLLMAKRSEVPTVKSFSFVILIVGAAILLLGSARTRLLLFPLLFIVTMMPLVPDQLINTIAFPIQITSARIAAVILNLFTLHAVREGTMLQMDSYTLAVELPCSGFKTLVGLLTFAAAFAYLVEAATWKRWTLFLVTIPLSLVINAVRIALIGAVGELGSTAAAATFHDYSGMIVITLAFCFLYGFARLLRCDRFLGMPLNEAEEQKDREATTNAPDEPAWWQQAIAWRPAPQAVRRVTPFIAAMDVLLLSALAVQASVVHRAPALPPIATSQVPAQLSGDGVTWHDATSPPIRDRETRAVVEELRPLRLVNRDYVGTDGSRIGFFLTAGNGRNVFHDPHTCSLGSDATLTDAGPASISTPSGTVRLMESRFKMAGSPDSYEMMFFYVVQGSVIQRTSQVRTRLLLQTLLGDSGMPSYFFRVVQNSPGSDAAHRQQLMRFIRAMWGATGPILRGERPGIAGPPPMPIASESATP